MLSVPTESKLIVYAFHVEERKLYGFAWYPQKNRDFPFEQAHKPIIQHRALSLFTSRPGYFYLFFVLSLY